MRKERGYWKDINNIKVELINIIDNIGIENLSYSYLRNNGYNNIICGLTRMSLSLEEILLSMNFKIHFTPKGYFDDINNIINEGRSIIEKYGCWPSKEILISEGKSTVEVMIQRKLGGMKKFYELVGFNKDNQSSLEKISKQILDELIDSSELYIDNQRKDLSKYDVILQHPETKQWLELDRYYYNAKVAIEIQGKQHYVGSDHKVFGIDRVKRTIENDKIKSKLLHDQGISLIVIPYNTCSKSYILKQLLMLAKLKLRETVDLPTDNAVDNTVLSLNSNILESVTTSDESL